MTNCYFNLGGTHRAQTAIATLARLPPIMEKLQITRVANVTGLDCIDVPVFIAIRPNAKHISVSQGKGITPELAKVSAIMESIEQWHAENIPPTELHGSYNELNNNYNIVDPTTLAHSIYDSSVLREWSLPWLTAIDLTTQQQILVPYHALSLDSTHPHKAALLFQTSTNGLASGNTVEEAMFHALCEVIERDAYYHWHQLPGAQKLERLVANNSINSELAKHLLLQLYQAAIDVKVWDLTSNLGIPAFQCVLSDQAISRGTQVFAGKGCHFDKEIALMRAITEAIQVRLTFITGSRDDVFPSYYKKNLPATHLDLIGKHDYQTIAQPTYQQNFTDNVKDLVQLFNKHGYPQVIAVNHTRTDIGIPVVHMLVPKLNVLIEAA